MNELKPVACRMKRLDETIFIDNERDAILFAEQGWAAESVYIIPDTHRVVSVETLREAAEALEPMCQQENLPALLASRSLLAVINNKEPT